MTEELTLAEREALLTPEQREKLYEWYRRESAKDTVTLMREATDLDDEEIFKDITAWGASEEEAEILAELLGVDL